MRLAADGGAKTQLAPAASAQWLAQLAQLKLPAHWLQHSAAPFVTLIRFKLKRLNIQAPLQTEAPRRSWLRPQAKRLAKLAQLKLFCALATAPGSPIRQSGIMLVFMSSGSMASLAADRSPQTQLAQATRAAASPARTAEAPRTLAAAVGSLTWPLCIASERVYV